MGVGRGAVLTVVIEGFYETFRKAADLCGNETMGSVKCEGIS